MREKPKLLQLREENADHLGFWGKWRSPDQWLSLPNHGIDVAFVFRLLIESPLLGRRLETATGHQLVESQRDRLAVIAMLHDLGKCNWGFQAKANPRAPNTTGHVIEAGAFLLKGDMQRLWPREWSELVGEMCSWFTTEEQLRSMLLAAVSHHGRPVSLSDIDAAMHPERWWRSNGGHDPMLGIDEIAQTVRTAFQQAFSADTPPIDATPALQQRFAGLVMLADWIGSDTRFFPIQWNSLEDRIALAHKVAPRALAEIGLTPKSVRKALSFDRAFGFPPRPMQAALAHDLPTEEDERLLLLESDTGSGKTEAALAWFLRLYESGKVDGLYFALPTRVAARELYARVVSAIEGAFPKAEDHPQPVLLAVPGYVKVDGMPMTLPDPNASLWEDDEMAREHERVWAAEHPKRFLAAPIAVGTIDQALLSVLKVKHALLRSVCLDRHLLVVDEVHASDPYMREVLKSLLAGHLARGGWALLLSATLGEVARSEFFGHECVPLDRAAARPYPAITTRSHEAPIAPTGRQKAVKVEFHDGLDDTTLLPQLVDAIARGARVLVVCNTVARANGLLRAIEADGRVHRGHIFSVSGVVCPHHGRFAREDREVMDAEVSSRLGKVSPGGALLLIGTQTLEQSLDIDADWLVTDLSPIDVLLQRIGRLHRHDRPRPAGFENARALVRIPPDGDLARYLKGGELKGPAGLGTVYRDGRVLQRTLDVLRDRPEIVIPDDNRWLVEQCTHPTALKQVDEPWLHHGSWLTGPYLEQVRQAETSTLDDAPFGELHYPAAEEHVRTRLGGEALEIPLAHPMSSPFGNLISRLMIPDHMKPRGVAHWPERIDKDKVQNFDEGFRFELCGNRYRYTRVGLEKDDA